MRILVLHLPPVAGNLPEAVAAALAENGNVVAHRSTAAALRQLGDKAAGGFGLLFLCGDDEMALLAACRRLTGIGSAPPIVVLSACASIETAVDLMRAGADDFIVRDPAGEWIARLADKAAATGSRRRRHSACRPEETALCGDGQRLAQIVDGSSVALFVLDHQHRVTHWNRACEVLTGIPARDILGTGDHWQAFYPEKRPCLADLIVDGAIEADITHYYADKAYRRSTLIPGSYEAEDFFPNFGDSGRWLYFTAAPLHDAAGRVAGAIETLQDITGQKQAKEALHASETLLRQIIQCSSVATFVIDERHVVTHWNRAAEILLGTTANEAIGTRTIAERIYHRQRPLLADLVLDGADDKLIERYYEGRHRRSGTLDGVFEIEDRFTDLPGGERWLHFAAAPLHGDDGRTIGAIETLIDITERKRAEVLRNESERRLAQIVDGSAVATFVIDRQHRVTHWNRACAALTGLPADELVGTREHWRAFYCDARPCLADLVLDGAMDERVSQYYGGKKAQRSAVIAGGFEAEDFFAAFGNSGRWLYFTAAPLRDTEGTVIGAIETLQDITEQKRAEEQLRQSEERYRVLSITDGMTGLYNARHFAQRLREEMDRCERYRHSLSLMVLDVDNFKTFNDTWGHVQGDQVLIQLAECITACLRRTDQAFRYGGEEFVALLPETNLDEAEAAAERIRSLFERSDIAPAPGQRIECTASIGVTAFVPGETPRDFVARADSGTYEAKRQGKNRVIRILPPNL